MSAEAWDEYAPWEREVVAWEASEAEHERRLAEWRAARAAWEAGGERGAGRGIHQATAEAAGGMFGVQAASGADGGTPGGGLGGAYPAAKHEVVNSVILLLLGTRRKHHSTHLWRGTAHEVDTVLFTGEEEAQVAQQWVRPQSLEQKNGKAARIPHPTCCA